jgi:mono/diheme cytochrome c family protein
LLRRIRTGFVLSVLAFLVSLSYVSGWPWNTDMIQQPTIRPYQTVILPPPDSVPVGGEHYLPRNIIAERLRNPVAATPPSIENGKKMFLTYCAPCHGINGTGHGTVAQGEFQPPDLTGERIQKMNDATIFGTITDGWLTMPSYRETMTIQERWDTVNYVRHLQATKQH